MGFITNIIIKLCQSKPNDISHTKVWSNIGMLALTVCFCYECYRGTLGSDFILIYTCGVAVPHLASKFLTLRLGVPPKVKNEDYEKQ